MTTPTTAAIEGYVGLGKWWVKEWGEHLTAAMGVLYGGTYDLKAGTKVAGECASFAAESVVLLVSEAFDAAATIAAGDDPQNIVTAQVTGSLSSPGTGPRFLKMRGPLTCALGGDTIPPHRITIKQEKVVGANASFELVVDATGRDGGYYQGSVGVVPVGSTKPVEEIAVGISVP